MSKSSKKVGYKNPPVSHQWKKGQSGNPSGKKKTHQVAPQPLLAVITEQLQKPVELNHGGQTSSVPLLTAFVMKMLHEMMGAPFPQKMAAIAALAKLGVFHDHKVTLECAAAESDPVQPIFGAAERELLKHILGEENLDGP